MKKIINYLFKNNTRKKAIPFVILLAVVIAFVMVTKDSSESEEADDMLPLVTVGTVADIINSNDASFIGTVRAVSEAQIQSEASGRVTAVYVDAGDEVFAGTILATLENSAQSAALLQAQGAYEAALASAAQSEVSVEEAQNNAINTYRSAYTTTYASVVDDVDVFFGDPNSLITPGVRIDAFGNEAYLNNTRKSLRTTLETWRTNTNSISKNSDLMPLLAEAETNVRSVIGIVDVLTVSANNADESDTLDGVSVKSYAGDLSATRATLNSVLASLSSAEEVLRKAQISATQNSEVSLSNAQVKQALGTLRSAEANYEKTVFRTPIAGTVNSLRINVGDYVSAFTQVAEVANNDALQISVFVGERDLSRFTIGDSVTINGIVEGTVTSIAPAVDPVTQKTEVKIAAESTELINGSTVSVTLTRKAENAGPTLIPITAIKFAAQDGSIFTVEDNKLVSHPVVVGDISGSLVTILEGIEYDTEFVLDARGLSEGGRVEATRNQD